MFDALTNPHETNLDEVIASAISALQGMEEGKDDYTKTTDNLVQLMKIRTDAVKLAYDSSVEFDRMRNESAKIDLDVEKFQFEKDKHNSWRPSADAVIGVLGTIAAAILVLNYEKAGVVTSKAFAFIGKTMR